MKAILFLIFLIAIVSKVSAWNDKGCPDSKEYQKMCSDANEGDYCGPNSWGNFECCKSGVECKKKSPWWTDEYKACAGWNGQAKLGSCPDVNKEVEEQFFQKQ